MKEKQLGRGSVKNSPSPPHSQPFQGLQKDKPEREDHDIPRKERLSWQRNDSRSYRWNGCNRSRYLLRPALSTLLSDYIAQNKKVTVQLLAAFRYGREDLDVLGLTFRKDLISQFYQVCFQVERLVYHLQVYPPTEPQRACTRLQERLQKKLGPNAFPFWFDIPPYSASSVTLQVVFVRYLIMQLISASPWGYRQALWCWLRAEDNCWKWFHGQAEETVGL